MVVIRCFCFLQSFEPFSKDFLPLMEKHGFKTVCTKNHTLHPQLVVFVCSSVGEVVSMITNSEICSLVVQLITVRVVHFLVLKCPRNLPMHVDFPILPAFMWSP